MLIERTNSGTRKKRPACESLIGADRKGHVRHAVEIATEAHHGRRNLSVWPAPSSEDTESGALMEPEVDRGEVDEGGIGQVITPEGAPS